MIPNVQMGWKLIVTLFMVVFVALGAIAVAYAGQAGAGLSTGATTTGSPQGYFSWAVSNDDGATSNAGSYVPIDPGDNGADPQQPQSQGVTASRFSSNSAATAASAQSTTMTVNLTNAYPGYFPTIFFGLKNGSDTTAQVTSIAITYPAQLSVLVTGVAANQLIGMNAEVVGAVQVRVNESALQSQNYVASVTITVSQYAAQGLVDLSITKFGSPDYLATGHPLTYRLRVVNNGPETATNVTVTDSYPAGFVFKSANHDPNSGNNVWVFSRLRPGKVRTIIIKGTVTAGGGSITNTATVTSATPEINIGNNTASTTTFIKPGDDKGKDKDEDDHFEDHDPDEEDED